jgi:hypothetical protein
MKAKKRLRGVLVSGLFLLWNAGVGIAQALHVNRRVTV